MIALRERVFAEVDDTLSKEQAEATITLKNGTKLLGRVEHAIGSMEHPMSDDDRESKFRDLAAGVLAETQTRQLITASWKIASADDIKVVTRFGAKA